MTKFNNDIKTRYTKIRSMITKVLNASNEKELDSLQRDAANLIADTNKVCDLTINRELRDLRSEAAQAQPREQPSERGQLSPRSARQAPDVPKAVLLEVLHNFRAESDGELSVQKGERLGLVNPDVGEGWYLARKSTGEEGLVPETNVKRV